MCVLGVELVQELDEAAGDGRVRRPEFHPIEPYQVVVLFDVLTHLVCLAAFRGEGRALDVGVLVSLAHGDEAALSDGDGRIVERLAEVRRDHVLYRHSSSSPSNRYSFTSSLRAPSIMAWVKT